MTLADIAAGGLSITAERARRFDFSQPTPDAGLQILVPHEDHTDSTPGLRSFLDLLWSKSMVVWLGPPRRSPSSRPTSCGRPSDATRKWFGSDEHASGEHN